jgi:hypothetical protein
VGGTSTAGVDGARLRRAVGSNWLSNAAIACPGGRIGDCLLDTVFRKIAQTYRVLLGTEISTSLPRFFQPRLAEPEARAGSVCPGGPGSLHANSRELQTDEGRRTRLRSNRSIVLEVYSTSSVQASPPRLPRSGGHGTLAQSVCSFGTLTTV